MDISMIVGWVLGLLSIGIGAAAVYYLHQASKAMRGGAIGGGFKKIVAGVTVLLISIIWMATILTWVTEGVEHSMYHSLSCTTLLIVGFSLILLGSREIARLTKV